MKRVLDHVAEQARYDPSDPERGVLTIVFVHGWKHNAQADDGNVQSFTDLLRQVHALRDLSQQGTPRKVIGVYVGWRGLSVDLEPLTEVSYWERKAVAEQVAKGGVTELLLRLEREVVDPERPNRNLYLVTGHSFGGAVVLSALNEIFLERVAAAVARNPGDDCVQTRPFGHGVVLLNPAIEANEVFQLKEFVAETCFVPTQPRLLHVISSDADKATNKAFRLGQWLGVSLTWRQATLPRQFDGRAVQFDESDLDTFTVGNFLPFQTGQLDHSNATDSRWQYTSCIGEEPACIDPAQRAQHIPVEHNEPLAFIQTDETFIADHNDVFNDNVSAYLAAVIAENRYKRIRDDSSVVDLRLPEECRSDAFGPCFDLYQKWFESVE
jgi:pimeloyl-ACP methyl ester carboxylesterase